MGSEKGFFEMIRIGKVEGEFPETHLGHYWGPSIAPPVNVHPFGVEGESGGDGGDVGTTVRERKYRRALQLYDTGNISIEQFEELTK